MWDGVKRRGAGEAIEVDEAAKVKSTSPRLDDMAVDLASQRLVASAASAPELLAL